MSNRYLAVLVLVAVAGAAVVWMTRPPELAFRPVAKPQGFRELILPSAPDALSAVLSIGPPGRSPADEDDALPEGASLCDALFRDADAPQIGAADSPLTVVEFFDYRCPYCRVLTESLLDLQARTDGVRVVFKEWPILSKGSVLAARAALAAAEQGSYVGFHRRMMKARFVPTEAYIADVAVSLGLDRKRLLADMDSDRISRIVKRNAAVASRLGLTGTPVLVVGRTIVQGAISTARLEQLVRLELSSGIGADC